MNAEKLEKLFSYLFKSKIDVKFTADEVEEFNSYIYNKDVFSAICFFEKKENINYEVLNNIIDDKTEGIISFVAAESYEKWEPDELSFEEAFEQLTDYEKLALMVDRFNCHFVHGGLRQWNDSEYSKYLIILYQFVKNSDFDQKNIFIDILDGITLIRDSIKKLDCHDEWYEHDYQARLNSFNDYNKMYCSIKENWCRYFENYLLENITPEYVNKILSLKEDIEI